MDFILRMQVFAEKAVKLHKDLIHRSDELPEGEFEPPTGRLTTAFRFIPKNPIDDIFNKISISTPMDSGCIETALFKNDNMINDELLGYGDSIKRFYNIDDLIKELNRLDGTTAKSQKESEEGEVEIQNEHNEIENPEEIVILPISTIANDDNLPVATQVERII